jgi:hypothetical protein
VVAVLPEAFTARAALVVQQYRELVLLLLLLVAAVSAELAGM